MTTNSFRSNEAFKNLSDTDFAKALKQANPILVDYPDSEVVEAADALGVGALVEGGDSALVGVMSEGSKPTGFFGDMKNAVSRSIDTFQQAADLAEYKAGIDDSGNTANQLVQNEYEKKLAPMSDEMTGKMNTIQEKFKEGWGAGLWELAKNPSAIPVVAAESVANFAPSIAGGYVGGAAGTAVMPGAGTVAGVVGGIGAGAYYTEYFNTVLQNLNEAGAESPQEFQAFLENDTFMAEVYKNANERGIPVAIAEGLTAGLAGKVYKSAKTIGNPAYKAAKETAKKGEKLAYDVSKKRVGAGLIGEAMLQGGGGAAGEAGAILNDKGEITADDRFDIAIEGVAELPGSLVDVPLKLRAESKAQKLVADRAIKKKQGEIAELEAKRGQGDELDAVAIDAQIQTKALESEKILSDYTVRATDLQKQIEALTGQVNPELDAMNQKYKKSQKYGNRPAYQGSDNNLFADQFGLPNLPGKLEKKPDVDTAKSDAGTRYAEQQQDFYSLDPNSPNPSIPKQAADLPKLPDNYSDARLQNVTYRGALEQMVTELQIGGDRALVPNMNQSPVSVIEFKKAVGNALDGKPLSDKQKRIVTEALSLNDANVKNDVAYEAANGTTDYEAMDQERQMQLDRESMQEYFSQPPVRPNGNSFTPTVAEVDKAVSKAEQGRPLSKSESSLINSMRNINAWKQSRADGKFDSQSGYGQSKSSMPSGNAWQAQNPKGRGQSNGLREQLNGMEVQDAKTKSPETATQKAKEKTVEVSGQPVVDNSIKLSKSGKPFKSEKTARMSQTFKETPNAEIVPVDGGFGVREVSVSDLKGNGVSVSESAKTDTQPDQEAPEQVIERLGRLIDERRPKEYSEMDANVSDISYLNDAEKTEFQKAKLELQDNGRNSAEEARARNLARREAKRAAKSEMEQDTESPKEKIDDFGEKLEGAKKFTFTFKESLDSEIDTTAVPLSKSFPKPDYQKLLDGGLSKLDALRVAMLRNSIPSKPRKGYKVKNWAKSVDGARQIASMIIKGDIDRGSSLGLDFITAPLDGYENHLDSITAENIEALAKWKVSNSNVYSMDTDAISDFNGENVDSDGRFEGKINIIKHNNRSQGKYFLDRNKAVDSMFELFNSTTDNKLAKFDVYSINGVPPFTVGKKVAAGKYLDYKSGFETAREARDFIRDNNAVMSEWLANNKKTPSMRKDSNNPRVGEDYRQDKDVTPEMFSDGFGFRGVQFGNWVEGGKRQQDLNNAYDGLMDLAGIIGVDPKALSLNGTLGLAFGARGSGGKDAAAAHYEPSTVVINLTKKEGAGSLAHEWFHAMDNYFAKMENQERVSNGDFATEMKRGSRMVDGQKYRKTTPEDFNIRKEVFDAFKALEKAINSETKLVVRSSQLDKTKSKDYWSTMREITARSFERYVIDKLAKTNYESDYLANIVSQEYWEAEQAISEKMGMESKPYPYPTDAEAEIVNKAYDNLFQTIETKETENGNVAMFSRKNSDTVNTTQEAKVADNETQDVATLRRSIEKYIGGTMHRYQESDIGMPDSVRRVLEETFGRRIVGFKTQGGFDFNGVVIPENEEVIYVNAEADKPVMAIAGHEFMHGLRRDNPQLYGQALDAMAYVVGDTNYDNFVNDFNAKTDANGEQRQTESVIAEELMADILGDNFMRPEFWAKVSKHLDSEKKGAFNQFVKSVKAFLSKVRNALSPLGSNQYLTDVEAAQDVVAKMAALHMKSRMGNKKAQAEIDTIIASEFVEQPSFERSDKVKIDGRLFRTIDAVFSGNRPMMQGIVIGDTPNVLVEIGAERLPLHINPSKIIGIKNKHDISGEQLKQAFFDVYNPVGVLKSKDGNGYVVITEVSDNAGSQVVAAIHLSKKKGFLEVNSIASVYGKNKLENLIESSEVLYFDDIDMKRPHSATLQLRMESNASNTNIVKKSDIVNKYGDTMFSRKEVEQDVQDDGTLESFRSKFGRPDKATTVKKWFGDLMNNLTLRLAQGIFDKYRPLLELDKSLYGDDVVKTDTTHSSWVLAKMSEAGQSALSVMMQYGRLKYDERQKVLKPVEGKGTDGFLNDMANTLGSSEEIDRFFRWVAANRSSELMKADKEHLFTAKEIEFGMRENEGTLEDGRSRKEAYFQAHEKFKMYHNDVLDIATQAGLVSKEARADWENQFYVPFYRVLEDDNVQNPGVSGGQLKPKEAYKKLKGGTQNVNDLLENTLMNWNHLLTNSMRNMASRQAIDNAVEAGVASKLRYDETSKRKTHVFVDGKKVEYDVSDQLVFDALTMITHSGIKGTSMDLARGFKRVFTNFTTASPQFIVANLIRDSLQAVAVTDGSSYNVGKNVAKGAKQFGTGLGKRMSKERAQIMAAGGSFSFGYVYGRNTDDVKYSIDKQLGKIIHTPSDAQGAFKAIGRGARTTWDKWQSINDMTENVNRMSIYDTIKNETDNELYAALQARDLMDFSAHGSYQAIRFLTDVVPFLNARLQGLDKIYRSGVKPSANALRAMFGGPDVSATDKQLAIRFAAVTGALTLATLALYASNEDDEDYRALEDWHKDTYWTFKVDGSMFHIPKPFEVGAIATVAERMMEQMISDNPEVDSKLLMERLKQMALGTFSFDPTPQIVKPALELWANEDSFTGRPIESMGMDRLSPELRYRQSTSELAKALSSAGSFMGDANISPVQYDHLIKGYLGWVGATANGQMTTVVNAVQGKESPAKDWYEYQPARRFYTNLDKPTYTKYSTMFYEYLRESNRIYSDIKAMRKDKIDYQDYLEENRDKLAKRKMLNKVQRGISAINSRMKMIRGSNKPADVKRQELDLLQTRKNNLQEMAAKRYLGER